MQDLVFVPQTNRPPPKVPPPVDPTRVSVDLKDFKVELELYDRHRGLAEELMALLRKRSGFPGSSTWQ